MGKIITIANQKGGVGKTTTAINLSSGLTLFNGYRVLLIDLDPQGNTTSTFMEVDDDRPSVYELFTEDEDIDFKKLIYSTSREGLYILPSTIKLAKVEKMLSSNTEGPIAIRKHILELAGNFDFVIFDTPPSLGLLTINALSSSDYVLMTITASPWALDGVQDFIDTIEAVREVFNPSLKVLGAVVTIFDSRTRLAKDVFDQAKEIFGDLLFKTTISRNVRLEESPAYGKDIFSYAPSSKGAFNYRSFVKEVLDRVS